MGKGTSLDLLRHAQALNAMTTMTTAMKTYFRWRFSFFMRLMEHIVHIPSFAFPSKKSQLLFHISKKISQNFSFFFASNFSWMT